MSTLTSLTTVVGSHGEHHGYWFPFAFFWLVLLGLLVWFVVRRGRWHHYHPSDMDRARGILAERFARGDIASEEFMESASILNWTPGTEPLPSKPRKKRR